MDVFMACPIFVDGRLFAWVSNAGHQYDLGGIAPGGFPPDAVDIFSDPIVLPPVKFVERGEIRRDLMDLVLRQSRMRDLVALDLRAQMSGCLFARNAILDACREFRPGVVKAAMRRIVSDAQLAFSEQLRRIPDGTYSQVRYLDEKLPGDRGTYRVQVNLEKRGDRLRVDNEGTDAQMEGPLGFPFAGFAGSTLAPIAVTMLYDQLFAIGGAEKQIDYEPTPGLLTCIDHPAATSFGVCSIVTHAAAVQACLCRMLSSDEQLEAGLNVSSGDYPIVAIAGENEAGRFYGQPLLDHLAGGMGARAHADGVNSSGPTWSPLSNLLDVETVEQWYPIVYLYRREEPDTAGAGRWRGGSGLAVGWMPYRAKSMILTTFTQGGSISTHAGPGVFGGYPSPPGRVVVRHGTDIMDSFARGSVPATVAALAGGEEIALRGKQTGVVLGPEDVAEARWSGGGGFGDPLERPLDLVAEDCRTGYVSLAAAREIYGIVLDDAGELDRAASERRRREAIEQRSLWREQQPRFPGAVVAAAPRTRINESLERAEAEGGGDLLACRRCGEPICGYEEDPKGYLLVDEGAITQLPGVRDPAYFIDGQFVLRRYCCPSCHVLMATDVARAEEGPLSEMRLAAVRKPA
jgi:N-methylhydantoinase B